MTELDIKQTATLLQQLEPGFLPYDIFLQVARLSVLSIVELMPLRYRDGQIEILLLERDEKDTIWPGQLHSPGTVLRPTDSDPTKEAFERIMHGELRDTELSLPQFVKSSFYSTARGKEYAQIFWVHAIGEAKIGKFYPIDNLPPQLMASQLDFIKSAAISFKPLV